MIREYNFFWLSYPSKTTRQNNNVIDLYLTELPKKHKEKNFPPFQFQGKNRSCSIFFLGREVAAVSRAGKCQLGKLQTSTQSPGKRACGKKNLLVICSVGTSWLAYGSKQNRPTKHTTHCTEELKNLKIITRDLFLQRLLLVYALVSINSRTTPQALLVTNDISKLMLNALPDGQKWTDMAHLDAFVHFRVGVLLKLYNIDV